jgi:hypothetical protein
MEAKYSASGSYFNTYSLKKTGPYALTHNSLMV